MADKTRIVHLRNDNGSTYKWPTLQIGEHKAGEVLAITLGAKEPVPFGFTEVDPETGEAVVADAKSEAPEAESPLPSGEEGADAHGRAGASHAANAASDKRSKKAEEPVNHAPAEEKGE